MRRTAFKLSIVLASVLICSAYAQQNQNRSDGELHILPVGLGMFGKLAPKGFEASAIALWFSAGVIGNLLAGAVGTLWSGVSHAQFFTLRCVDQDAFHCYMRSR